MAAKVLPAGWLPGEGTSPKKGPATDRHFADDVIKCGLAIQQRRRGEQAANTACRSALLFLVCRGLDAIRILGRFRTLADL
jgi:hypothetical protein